MSESSSKAPAESIILNSLLESNNPKAKERSMINDLEEMMYGFGDEWPVDSESVKLLDILVRQYIEDITYRAVQISKLTGELDKECFMYLVRRDRKRFNRIHQLLVTNEELKAAQSFDNTLNEES